MFTLTYTPKHVFSYIELTAVYTVYRYTINNVNRYYNVYTAFFDCRIQAVYNRIDKINRNRKNCKTVNNIYIYYYYYFTCIRHVTACIRFFTSAVYSLTYVFTYLLRFCIRRIRLRASIYG